MNEQFSNDLSPIDLIGERILIVLNFLIIEIFKLLVDDFIVCINKLRKDGQFGKIELYIGSWYGSIVTSSSFMQLSKTLLPKKETDEGINTLVNDVQFEKALLPIDFTDDGIFNSSNDMHPEKANESIDSKEEGKFNCVSNTHWLKAPFFIKLKEEGNITFFNNEQLLNASSSIISTPSGIVISSSEV